MSLSTPVRLFLSSAFSLSLPIYFSVFLPVFFFVFLSLIQSMFVFWWESSPSFFLSGHVCYCMFFFVCPRPLLAVSLISSLCLSLSLCVPACQPAYSSRCPFVRLFVYQTHIDICVSYISTYLNVDLLFVFRSMRSRRLSIQKMSSYWRHRSQRSSGSVKWVNVFVEVLVVARVSPTPRIVAEFSLLRCNLSYLVINMTQVKTSLRSLMLLLVVTPSAIFNRWQSSD